MNNKLFFALVGLILLSLFGWMAYDSWRDQKVVVGKDLRWDLLGAGLGGGTQVQYLFHFKEPSYFHDLNTSQIEALRPGGVHENARVRGLTLADYGMNAQYTLRIRKKWFKDHSLAWADDLRVEFSYNTLNVYVTSDFPEGGCEYRETLGHENEHVEIHKRVFEKYQGVLRAEMAGTGSIPLESSPLTVLSLAEGKERVGQVLSAVTDPVFQRFSVELSEEEARIDTRESYSELRSRCPGW